MVPELLSPVDVRLTEKRTWVVEKQNAGIAWAFRKVNRTHSNRVARKWHDIFDRHGVSIRLLRKLLCMGKHKHEPSPCIVMILVEPSISAVTERPDRFTLSFACDLFAKQAQFPATVSDLRTECHSKTIFRVTDFQA